MENITKAEALLRSALRDQDTGNYARELITEALDLIDKETITCRHCGELLHAIILCHHHTEIVDGIPTDVTK